MSDSSPTASGESLSEFTIELERLEDYRFVVSFDWPQIAPLELDEPEPLGHQSGPNASRLLAAAVGNCLSASLLFCLEKTHLTPTRLTAHVRGQLERNQHGRLRIGRLDVDIDLANVAPDAGRLQRCLRLFEDYCVVTASVREGIAVDVHVRADGQPV